MKKPLILISNDDGITAKGIRILKEIMMELGEVVIVAPDSPQSGMGHAITINDPLRIHRSEVFKDVEAYECSGTPADCIKIAKHHLLKGRTPDLVVSGINHGSNTAVSVIYSGTMSAAIEAAIEGMPAIGFSVCEYGHDIDFDHTRKLVLSICKNILKNGITKGVALNVNFPASGNGEIKGVKVCRQARAKWQEEFDERTDPSGRKYLWLTGQLVNPDKGEDTDEWAIANGFASIVPVSIDMTAHHYLSDLNELNF